MKNVLGIILLVCQYACIALAILVSAYLLYRWNMARETNPADPNPLNPWWPGLLLAVMSHVFKLARKGVRNE